MPKEDFVAGNIQDADAWNKIIATRNITSHGCDEKIVDTDISATKMLYSL
ncbi:hypothetical protein [Faecalibacterium prausnitzii]|nr:hypothetical protein [Faecalibacterium prausnitzii]